MIYYKLPKAAKHLLRQAFLGPGCLQGGVNALKYISDAEKEFGDMHSVKRCYCSTLCVPGMLVHRLRQIACLFSDTFADSVRASSRGLKISQDRCYLRLPCSRDLRIRSLARLLCALD